MLKSVEHYGTMKRLEARELFKTSRIVYELLKINIDDLDASVIRPLYITDNENTMHSKCMELINCYQPRSFCTMDGLAVEDCNVGDLVG